MKLKIALVLLLCVISYSVGQPEILECIQELEDFEMHNWTTYKPLRYAEDSSELPGAMNGAIHGRGIFYVDGSQESSQNFYKRLEDFVNIRPAYIYVKYYAHIENVTNQMIYTYPALPQQFYYLPHSPNFTWREALVEIDADCIGAFCHFILAAVGEFLVRGDFLLVDSFILAQGANISDISEIKALCPLETEPTTTTETTTIETTTTETTTTERPTTSSERPTTTSERPTTSSERPSTTTPTTSSERPTTTSERPTTSSERPTTSPERPTTSSERPSTTTPTTSSERPTTTSERPTTSSERPTTSPERPTTSSERPTTTTERLSDSNASTIITSLITDLRSCVCLFAIVYSIIFSYPH